MLLSSLLVMLAVSGAGASGIPDIAGASLAGGFTVCVAGHLAIAIGLLCRKYMVALLLVIFPTPNANERFAVRARATGVRATSNITAHPITVPREAGTPRNANYE